MNAALSGVPFNRANTVQRLSLRIISMVIYNLIQRLIVTVLCNKRNTDLIISQDLYLVKPASKRDQDLIQSLQCAE